MESIESNHKLKIIMLFLFAFFFGLLLGLYFSEFYFLMHLCNYLIIYSILLLIIIFLLVVYGNKFIYFAALGFILGSLAINIYNYYTI